MRYPVCLLSLAVALGATALSEASVIVTVADMSVTAGSGTVDLAVTISGEPLLDFTIVFNITGGTTTHMEFLSQNVAGHGPTLDDPFYVFKADSGNLTVPSSFGSASGGPPYNTTFIGSDTTNSFNDLSIGSANNLLARLRLTVPTYTSGSGPDTFTVTLDATRSSFDDNAGSVAIDPLSKFSGNITVGPSTATNVVPEPSTLISACLAVAASLLGCRRRPRASV